MNEELNMCKRELGIQKDRVV